MTFLQMSFSGTILILVIALIRKLLFSRLPKQTFLFLWGIALLRLLAPISVPADFSVYSLANRSNLVREETDQALPTVHLLAKEGEPVLKEPPKHVSAEPKERNIPYVKILWFLGAVCGLAFFSMVWLRCRWDQKTSVPVENPYVKGWLKAHPLRRTVEVRQSDRITAPMTCGIFRPVILMPRRMDWEREEELHYILLHEYIHIRHFDMLWKLCLAAALCIHWFNPGVWLMYFLCNQDLEFACDEEVVRCSGREFRSAYALTLIHMEERKSGISALYSHFSGHAAQKRITAIMKMKKRTVPAVVLAGVLVLGTGAVFATSAKEELQELPRRTKRAEEAVTKLLSADYTEGEIQWLLSLWPQDYQEMTVAEYRQKIWEKEDESSTGMLLADRFSKEEWAFEMENPREAEALNGFLDYFYRIFEPLTAESEAARDTSVWAMSDVVNDSDTANFEGDFHVEILEADKLRVEEYYRAYCAVAEGMETILDGWTEEELLDEKGMNARLQERMEGLLGEWNSENLRFQIGGWVYRPPEDTAAEETRAEPIPDDTEERQYPPGTEEDYASLLELMVPGYQEQSLEEFNRTVLNWCNEDYERMERVMIDTGTNGRRVFLTEEEAAFVEKSVLFSAMENGQMVRSLHTGQAEEDPCLDGRLPDRVIEENGMAAWASLFYRFSWHIEDKRAVTVGTRDAHVGGMLAEVRKYWETADIEDLLRMTENEVEACLAGLAEESSGDGVTIQVQREDIFWETMDERFLERG